MTVSRVIALVGMSGCGKSYWSKVLNRELGFERYCCDDLIESKLRTHLQVGSHAGIKGVSRWMGQPYQPQFKRNEALYLQAERESMTEILDEVENRLRESGTFEGIVIDTTGSVIYTGSDICERLRLLSSVIHFETPPAVRDKMFRQYLQSPKPVVWGDLFQMSEGQDFNEALRVCYPALLEFREGQYARLAHETLSQSFIAGRTMTADLLLERAFG